MNVKIDWQLVIDVAIREYPIFPFTYESVILIGKDSQNKTVVTTNLSLLISMKYRIYMLTLATYVGS